MHPLEDKIWSNLYYYLYFFLYRSTKSVRTSLSWTSFRQVRTQIALYNPPSYTIYTSVYFKFVPKGQQANWSEFNLHRSFNLSVWVCLSVSNWQNHSLSHNFKIPHLWKFWHLYGSVSGDLRVKLRGQMSFGVSSNMETFLEFALKGHLGVNMT